MNLRYGILAEVVTPGEGAKKNIIGTFDVIFAQGFPAVHRHMSLFLRIEGHLAEEGEHMVKVQLLNADGGVVGAPPEVICKLDRAGRPVSDAPLAAELVYNIDGLAIPVAGDYEFAVFVDGRYLGGVPLYVRERLPAAQPEG